MGDDILLNYWDTWKGSILCSYSRKLFTADELKYKTEAAAAKLKSMGVKKGEIVALLLKNTLAFPVCLMALLKLEANPLLLHADTTGAEVKHIAESICLAWVLKDRLASKSKDRSHGREEFHGRKAFHNTLEGGCFEIGKVALELYPQGSRADPIPEAGVILHQTSGTYGRPLQCIRNQKVAVAEAVNYVSTIEQFDKITIRFTTPLNHAFAYGFGLISTIITDSTMIIDTGFNPKKVLKEETGGLSDILCLVPPMLEALIYLKQMDPSLKLPQSVYYAGTMCAASLVSRFEAAFDSKLYAILGSTETGAIACSNRNNKKAKGVGRILNNVDVLIKNKSRYRDLGNQVGELYVKSTSMMQRYCDDNFSEAIDYFPTGDLAKLDQDGDLHMIGRIKDIINIGGIKVDPVEVERVLLKYEGVQDAVVYPGCAGNGNEIVLAAVSVHKDFKESDMISFCAKYLNSYKIPEAITLLKDIPRTASGKCTKTKLPGYYNRTIFA